MLIATVLVNHIKSKRNKELLLLLEEQKQIVENLEQIVYNCKEISICKENNRHVGIFKVNHRRKYDSY